MVKNKNRIGNNGVIMSINSSAVNDVRLEKSQQKVKSDTTKNKNCRLRQSTFIQKTHKPTHLSDFSISLDWCHKAVIMFPTRLLDF